MRARSCARGIRTASPTPSSPPQANQGMRAEHVTSALPVESPATPLTAAGEKGRGGEEGKETVRSGGGEESIIASGRTDTEGRGDLEGRPGESRKGRKGEDERGEEGGGEEEGEGGRESASPAESEVEPGYSMVRVCDRLMDVFLVERPQPSEWRRLLAHSREWQRIRPHMLARCRVRARQSEMEGQLERAEQLYRLARRLEEARGRDSQGEEPEAK